jgi:5-methylthioribose kinase
MDTTSTTNTPGPNDVQNPSGLPDMSRESIIAQHPAFPWLTTENSALLTELFLDQGWLRSGEKITNVYKAGEGVMNLTLRIKTTHRTLILKQARPWIERLDHIPAPWDRIEAETFYYQRTAGIPSVQKRSPEILGYSSRAKTLLMADLSPCRDMTHLYAKAALPPKFIDSLADYLARLHTETMGDPDLPTSREMRNLSYQNIFITPMNLLSQLELDKFELGLNQAASRLKTNTPFRELVDKMAHRYLQEGPCLCHGDSEPSSWLETQTGLVVIDPEFCFPGDPEFDLGFSLAHLALAQLPMEAGQELLTQYRARRGPAISSELVTGYAICETMRRLIGATQLPLPRTSGWRVDMLEKCLAAMRDKSWKNLWA